MYRSVRVAALCSGLLAMSASAATQTTPLCPALKQIIAAAAENPPYKSLVDSTRYGTLVPTGFRECEVGEVDRKRYLCTDRNDSPNFGPPKFNYTNGAVAECLGLSRIEPTGTTAKHVRYHVKYRKSTIIVDITLYDYVSLIIHPKP